MIIAGQLVSTSGVQPGQVRFVDGVIDAVGPSLGKVDYEFPDSCLIFAGMGDIHIHAREDISGRQNYKETFATAAAAALHGGGVPPLGHLARATKTPPTRSAANIIGKLNSCCRVAILGETNAACVDGAAERGGTAVASPA